MASKQKINRKTPTARKAQVAKSGKRSNRGEGKPQVQACVAWDQFILAGYVAGWAKAAAEAHKKALKAFDKADKAYQSWVKRGEALAPYAEYSSGLVSYSDSRESEARQEAFMRLVKGAVYGLFHKPKVEKTWKNRGGRKANPKSGYNAPLGKVKEKTLAQLKAEARQKAFKAMRHLSVLGKSSLALIGAWKVDEEGNTSWVHVKRKDIVRAYGPGAAEVNEPLPGMEEAEPAATPLVTKENKMKKKTIGLMNHLGAMGFHIESGDKFSYVGGVVTLPAEAYLGELCMSLVTAIAQEKGKLDKLDRLLSKSNKETGSLLVLEAINVINGLTSVFEDIPMVIRNAQDHGMDIVSVGQKLTGAYVPEYRKVQDVVKAKDKENLFVITPVANSSLDEAGIVNMTVSDLVFDLMVENGERITKPSDLISLFSVNRKAAMVDGKLVANWVDNNQSFQLVVGYGEDPEKLENGEPIAGGLVWTINNKVINPYQVINGKVVKPEVVLYALLSQIVVTDRIKTVEGILNVKAVSCFRQEFYDYAVYDDAMKVVCADKVGMLKLTSLDGRDLARPSLTDTGTTLDFAIAAKSFMEAGIISVPDSQIKALYAARAARIKGLALVGDKVHSMNDASKPNKFFNRPSLNVQQQAGLYGEKLEVDELNTVEGANRRGVKMHVMLTNLVINPGEGVSWARKDMSKVLNLTKTITVVLPNLQDAGDVDGFKKRLMSDLAVGPNALNMAEAIMGADLPVLTPGKPVLWYRGKVIKTMDRTELMMARKILEIGVDIDPDGRNAVVKFKTDVSWNESQLKLRGANVKTTLWPGELVFESGREMPEVVLGVAGYKMDGNQLPVLHMAANTNGNFGTYDPGAGLTEKQKQLVSEFKQTNSSQEWITVSDLSYEIWDALRKDKGNCPEFDFPEPGVVRQLTDILEGYMVLSVEVSTVREAFGTQGLTGEYISSLVCEIPEIRERVIANMDRSVPGAIKMLNDHCDEIYSIANRCVIDRDVVFDLSSENLDKFNKDPYKAILAYMESLFPNGLTVLYDVEPESAIPESMMKDYYVSAHLDFKAIGRWESSKSKCASAALELIKLLAGDLEFDRFKKVAHRQIKMVRRAAAGMLSGAMTKSLTRTRNIQFSAKIKPIVTNEIGTWEIGLSVKTAKIMGVVDGDMIALSRSPMVSFGVLAVKVGNFPSALPVVNAVTWAAFNEGDGDGDGCAMLVLKKLGVDISYTRMLEINKSLSSTGGYTYMYGDMHDKFVKEFMSTGDMIKKNPLVDRVGETKIDHELYLATIENVGNHYKFFVGATFAMASAITFWYEISETIKANLNKIVELDLDSLTEEQHQALAAYMDKAPSLVRDNSLAKARVVVWRGLYEGQALSGWTEPASLLASTMSTIATRNSMMIGPTKDDLEDPQVLTIKRQEVKDFETMIIQAGMADLVAQYKYTHVTNDVFYYIGHTKEQLASGVTWNEVLDIQALLVAIACRRAGLFVEMDAAKHIGEANILRKVYGFIERNEDKPLAKVFNLGIASNFTEIAHRAVVTGMLRRTGGGMVHNEMLVLEDSNTLADMIDLDSMKAEFGMVDDCLLELGLINPLCGEIMVEAHPSLVAIDKFNRTKTQEEITN